jgi:hypothetical protein
MHTNRLDDPIEMLSPLYQGSTCQPPQIYNSKQCTQGGYSLYVVNASTTAQIQLALNFARNTGVRFVVRNTGHDFAVSPSLQVLEPSLTIPRARVVVLAPSVYGHMA